MVQLIQNLIEFAIYFGVFLGVALFSYAGLKMVISAGNVAQVEEAKKIFSSVAIGFLIVLAGWLFVDTLMKFFFQGGQGEEGSELFEATEQKFGPWNEIRCVDQPTFSREGNAAGAVNVRPDGTLEPGALEDSFAREQLQASGIATFSSGNCTDPNNRTCTSLEGVRGDTIAQTLTIKDACGDCTVRVTGGTETGHAGGAISHGSGHKIDLDDTPELDNFLKSRLTRDGSRGGSHGGERYRDACGNEYVRENSHWDITVTQACAL